MDELSLSIPDGLVNDAGAGRFGDKKTLKVLHRYFRRELTLEDPAAKLTAMLPQAEASAGRQSELSQFAWFLCEIVSQIPFDNPAQTRLVHLVEHLSKMSHFSYETPSSTCQTN